MSGKKASNCQSGGEKQDAVGGMGLEEEGGGPSVDLVFAQDMLRETILDYAIRTPCGNYSGSNVANARLVQKSWQISVSEVLAKNRGPLYYLILDEDNSLNGTSLVNANGKLLDQFVTAVSHRIEKPFPTFRLKMKEGFFQLENYDSFYNFLLQCSQGLVELELLVPRGAGSLPCTFFNVSFPKLRKMTVELTKTEMRVPPNPAFSGESTNVTLLLQTFLNRNESLNELVFSGDSQVIPPGFQYISLPSSITRLDMSCELKEYEPETLLRSSLPNLTALYLFVKDIVFPEGLLSRVLEKLGKTLRKLELIGQINTRRTDEVNLVTFPVMGKLEELEINSINLGLDSDLCRFDHFFPKLKQLILCDQPRTMFHKWTCSDSPASKVETLNVQLVDENLWDGQVGYTLPLVLEDMQRIHLKFPNVTNLVLHLTTGQICGLQYLFREMKQLTSLTFIVADHELTENSDLWDFILTGIPVAIIAGMRACRDFWKFMEFKHQELPSIRMLTELSMLGLQTPVNDQTQEVEPNQQSPMISDVTFEFALMKMDKLKSLDFKGRFKAPVASTEKWKTLRRTIKNGD